MQTTFKLFFSCLFGLTLTLLSGCGGSGGGGMFTESAPSLTPAEQAEVNKIFSEHGTKAITRYMETVNENTDKNRVLKYLKFFVSQGADVNVKVGDASTTPLHTVVFADNIDAIKFLVSKGADVNGKDNYGHGDTPLYSAVSVGNIEVVKFLVSKGADANAKRRDGDSIPFLIAALARRGDEPNFEIAEFLVSKGADVNVSDGRGMFPLALATATANVKFAELLVAKGADVNAKGEGGVTPLHWALIRDYYGPNSRPMYGDEIEIIKFLISKGADVNAKEDSGQTPLFRAIICERDVETIKLLISKGADVNVKDNYGGTPLDAANSENTTIIEYLKSVGAKSGKE